MCGRYTIFSDKENSELSRMVEAVNQKFNVKIKTGDIFPSNLAPIIREHQGKIELDVMEWGYRNPFKKGLIINARSETVTEKKMFRDDFEQRRCLIPASGFYEWDQQKHQYLFDSDAILYLGGIYKPFEGKNKFVILTKAPNPMVLEVHDRMPVIIPADMMDSWFQNVKAAMGLLKEDAVPLVKHQSEKISESSQIKFQL
ncbi:SOS response-associated peptidase [Acetobacterium bakii]|uniref:Abasic site processing protein n=1 Tax=Acetobacterium bakii TaxID=52689 RepID=A0A0L6TZ18_9FIRM|nr:SOS response-associated peptidase [Acetobacterium bakii]KNZ41509.1 hypothetical protein AKG39_10955 [Acetobacterium bakii]